MRPPPHETGAPGPSDHLLGQVYDELRKLAAQLLACERPGQTLQATALVHEAYMRLVGAGGEQAAAWDGRGHFFAAAAEAMRRILVEQARRKRCAKRGGGRCPVPLEETMAPAAQPAAPLEDLLALDEALRELEAKDAVKAQLVKLRYFAGLSLEESAELLGVSLATAKRYWVYARSWLYGKLQGD